MAQLSQPEFLKGFSDQISIRYIGDQNPYLSTLGQDLASFVFSRTYDIKLGLANLGESSNKITVPL